MWTGGERGKGPCMKRTKKIEEGNKTISERGVTLKTQKPVAYDTTD